MTLITKSKPAYCTELGYAYCADSREILDEIADDSIHLVITSPPFALQRQKDYGNHTQEKYVEWLLDFAKLVYRKLRPDGSFVLDLGGALDNSTCFNAQGLTN